ncbi:MAG TPA: hypothetical protein VEY08_00455 [Chloroflexia bacterium]|nr:hypothetical protein [Chloroflexia bacterium]
MRATHQMRVLIVAKTHMQGRACVGGLSLDPDRSVRLMQANGTPQPGDTPYEVGDLWQVECEIPAEVRPPHVEDVHVLGAYKIGQQVQLRRFLLQRIAPWCGPLNQTFEGLVRFTFHGHGYVNDIMGVPGTSTGFWQPDKPLQKVLDKEKVYYRYPRDRGPCLLKYVGYAPEADLIPAHSLVRLSLARWWKPPEADVEERCYLQLSGWYL